MATISRPQLAVKAGAQEPLEVFGQMLRRRPDEPYLETLARAWEQMTGPESRP